MTLTQHTDILGSRDNDKVVSLNAFRLARSPAPPGSREEYLATEADKWQAKFADEHSKRVNLMGRHNRFEAALVMISECHSFQDALRIARRELAYRNTAIAESQHPTITAEGD